MMRLPWFEHRAPTSVREAARILAGEGPNALLIAGGTDLLPNMKRRQQTPATLIGLRGIRELAEIASAETFDIGAGVALSTLVSHPHVRQRYPGLYQAAAQVATPHLRNMGTIGGNLCLDTRCTYYDQTYQWRKAIDFCMKKDVGDAAVVARRAGRAARGSLCQRRHALPDTAAGRDPDEGDAAGRG
jgi:4-hydroxybenzoyl-CoA reductase subunit beta